MRYLSFFSNDPATVWSSPFLFVGGVRWFYETAVETLNEGERMSVAAVAGKAGTHEVVRSVLAAEMTVQTVVSIRDRMVQAYQDVMRMAI
nr:flagellar hook-basal body complex protein FliE [Azospirillum argentinense]